MKKRAALPIKFYIPIYVCVIILCVVLDQLSKYAVEFAIKANGGKDIPIIGNWLVLHWMTNGGATGGMFDGLGWQNWLFFAMTLIGLPVFTWLLLRSRTRSVWGQIAFAFITGGTIGNALDRFIFGFDKHVFFGGEVRDFVQVKDFFGVFNVADSFLVVGVILAILAVVFFDPDSLVRTIIDERRKKTQTASQSEEHKTDENH